MNIALVRGAFLAQYEAQLYYPLLKKHNFVAFSSLNPIHKDFPFELVRLPSPMDIPFGSLSRFKMPLLNRLFIDAHYLFGLESRLDGFDIAHCADTFYSFTHQSILAKKNGKVKKVVATIFENIPFNNEGIWGRKEYKSLAINNIDHFIAISNRSKEALILEGCNPDKISVIGQRIDTKNFFPTKEKAKNNKNINILFAGRLEFYKGVYEVLFSAKRLLSDKDLAEYKLTFSFIGNGSAKPNMLNLINRMGISKNINFKHLDYKSMPKAYREADIFIAPSRATPTYQEQFSTVLLEAQASGLPIVTTGSGGIPENVEDAALVAFPGDFYSISNALKRFIVSPSLRREYGLKARKHSHKLDVEVGSREVEKIYENVLKEK